MIKVANIFLWDYQMGSIVEDDSGRIVLEYSPEFVASGINPSPIFVTPEKGRKYEFSQLPYEAFKGLPGFIADSLPDKFGTSLPFVPRSVSRTQLAILQEKGEVISHLAFWFLYQSDYK